ncbi:hypothetical protein TRFO_26165 [Tritrichomonas foetus]|uniref:Uncharacterized protein n=1 Tax=Tritrichomonas foetus TaxID=1144522 RepID=A0A1J4K8F7_9EUKA|nr:hypothetical protein TRFO_26165 [Tritrichomonas foetus]|eukprot:OHT05950.1 hypothetical protein TRFO_26165 [Tritrichomonas foetus]
MNKRNNFQRTFQKTLDSYKVQNEDLINDLRPVTGNVGQKKCFGFYTDMYGNVIRLLPEERGEEYIGPGSYSPEKPSAPKKGTTISSNSKRTLWVNNSFPVGPPDHHQEIQSKKIPHVIQKKVNPKQDITFLSGNLEHSTWGTPPSRLLPKRRFPQFKFATETNSRPFASREVRNLFPANEDAFSKPSEFKSSNQSTITVSDNESAVFRENTTRFPDFYNTNPSPCHYNPKIIDSAKSTSLSPTWGEVDVDPPPEMPGPGAYNTYQTSSMGNGAKSIVPPPRSKYVPKELVPKRAPIVDREKFAPPPPGSYDPKPLENTKIPTIIHNRDNMVQNDWAMTPELLTRTPKVGSYDIAPKKRITGGVMSVMGHRNPLQDKLDREQDHSLQYSTPHSSLLKRTYNVKYYMAPGSSK